MLRIEDFIPGATWVYRKPSTALGKPVTPVTVVAHAGQRNFIVTAVNPDDADLFTEPVNQTHLVCPQERWPATEARETAILAVTAYNQAQPKISADDHCATKAILYAAAPYLTDDEDTYPFRLEPDYGTITHDALARLLDRCNPRPELSEHGVSLDGGRYLPFVDMVALAVAFARSEPDTVHADIDAAYDEYVTERGQYLDEERCNAEWFDSLRRRCGHTVREHHTTALDRVRTIIDPTYQPELDHPQPRVSPTEQITALTEALGDALAALDTHQDTDAIARIHAHLDTHHVRRPDQAALPSTLSEDQLS